MKKNINDIPFIEILKNAWNITWKNKRLWWLGLFLGLGGGMNTNLPLDNNKQAEDKISQFISANWEIFITIIAILFILFLVLFIISIMARAGLIISLEKIIKGDAFEGFRATIKEGKKFFWKLFLLYLLLGLLIIASLLILAVPIIILFLAKSYFLGAALAILAILIFLPLAILSSYIKTYGEIYTVLGKLTAWSAVEASYELFRKNILTSIIMGLLFIPVGMILMIGMMIALAPLAILAFFVGLLGKVGLAIAIMIGLVIFLAAFLIQSVFQVFHQTTWLLFFNEIAAPTQEEKAEETVEERKNQILPAASDPVKMIENNK